ncbi:hypothetical protein PVT67_04070 [Gallaecimonas kandeliae]|uniref:hypothetical protein n=1 Tax=Gallaecimonas kandeliae TaxID=3029055 RepID=UPI0026497EBF|nr:hypothetical protein [Gallaecimonas kandeliae]WKE66438.1 hypothetical protein PVT67_04070 [Gallaecimonas kandeliae]
MFTVGQIYKRKEEIHGRFGGQTQGGISTPKAHPCVFLFTSDSGASYGYSDRFNEEDGTFWYTGEGQSGDMQLVKGNLAIQNHQENGKTLHLFEYVRRGHVCYQGQAICVGSHKEQRPDKDNELREVIIFHLALQSSSDTSVHEPSGTLDSFYKPTSKTSLKDLRHLALALLIKSEPGKPAPKGLAALN